MKLSPLSVPYRVLQRGGSVLFAVVFAAMSGAWEITEGVIGPLAVFGLLALGVLALIGYEAAYYRNYEYELTEETLDIRSGVFATRTREIPLRRIQNVDVSRNVIQRALGIAAVDFETAGGSDTEAAVRFVTTGEADRLQRELARRKRGLAGEDEAEPEGEELFALSDRELALLGAFSFDARIPGALFLLVSGSVPILSGAVPTGVGTLAALGGAAVVVGIGLLAWAAGAAVAVVNYYGFRLRRVGDELHYERGLLRRYDGTIPLDKVQTLTIEDDPFKRHFGYASLVIETAGYAPGGDDRGRQAAVPIARRERVRTLANAIERFGVPDFERPPRRVRRRYVGRYLLALGAITAGFLAADRFLSVDVPWYATAALLPLVPVAAHLKWRHRGRWLGDDHFVTRNGVVNRRTKIVPYYRVQTIIDARTIFQRRLHLASVTADTAGSLSFVGADATAVDVDDETAANLREELTVRLRAALADRRGRAKPAGADALRGDDEPLDTDSLRGDPPRGESLSADTGGSDEGSDERDDRGNDGAADSDDNDSDPGDDDTDPDNDGD